MGCSSSFHAKQSFMLNLVSQETDLGSVGFGVRNNGCLATCQLQGIKLALMMGLDIAAAWLKNNNLIHVEHVLKSRKLRFSGVGNPVELQH